MKTKLQEEVTKVLSIYPEYWEGENLIKSKVIEDIRKYREDLMSTFFSNDEIKKAYSVPIEGGLIFKVEDFISMLRFKQYWENSYTRYSNEVGISNEGKYLKYNSDMVIDFPHKDCVLEGGMSKDDSGKKEIYYHNVLAREEIDVMLSPKVLSNTEKITVENEEFEPSSYEDENLIIRGNNLIALSTITQRFAGSVDAIYIDPPYNVKSSNNTFLYNNRFNRSTWLVFMKNRLEIAKKLLTSVGSVIIAIDENEQAYLGVLLDEIFPDHDKHLITIVHNPRGVQGTNFSYTNEFAYFIIPKGKKSISDRQLSEEEVSWSPLRNWGGESLRTDARNCFYPIIVENGEIVGFGDVTPSDEHPEKNEKIGNQVYIYPIDTKGVERKWRYARQSVEEIKHMLRCVENSGIYDIQIGKTFGQYKTVWQDSKYDANAYGKQELNKWVPNNPFTFPKSVYTVYDCLYAVVGDKPNARILDFFAGSGTTGQATLMLNEQDKGNRKFVLIEQMYYAKTVIKERMKNLIKTKYPEQEANLIYTELKDLNMKYIDLIQEANNDVEINGVINELKESAYLNFQADMDKVISEEKGFADLSLEQKKSLLFEVLDLNQLYLSYSEIEDAKFNISESTKAFNQSFYEGNGEEE